MRSFLNNIALSLPTVLYSLFCPFRSLFVLLISFIIISAMTFKETCRANYVLFYRFWIREYLPSLCRVSSTLTTDITILIHDFACTVLRVEFYLNLKFLFAKTALCIKFVVTRQPIR